MRFCRCFFIFLGALLSPAFSYASSYPYGAGTIPYLVKNSELIVTLSAEITDLKDGAFKARFKKTHKNTAAETRNEMTIWTHGNVPGEGDLLFLAVLTQKAREALKTRLKIEVDCDAVVVTGNHGIISASSDRYASAIQFIEATKLEDRISWLVDALKSGDPDRLFDGQYFCERTDEKIFTEELIPIFLDTFLPVTARYFRVWERLAETDSALVKEHFIDWMKDAKYKTSHRNLVFALDRMPSAGTTLADWRKGKQGRELQNEALAVWTSHRSTWSSGKEADYKKRLNDEDPCVRMEAVEELQVRNFYRSTPPIGLLGERLNSKDELSVVKESILSCFRHSESWEATALLEAFILERSNDFDLRSTALEQLVGIGAFRNVLERTLKNLKTKLTDPTDKELSFRAGQLLRELERSK